MATNWTAINTPADLLSVANTNTSGWFWTGMLYMIWAVLVMLFINTGFETALLTASFICLIIGINLLYLGLVSLAWGVLTFVGIILTVIIYINWSSRSDSWG